MQVMSSVMSPAAAYTLDDLERELLRSKTVARTVIVGLPALGIVAALLAALPLFAILMTGSFLLATALVCRKALVRFTSRTLRLLVAARLVLVLVVGGLLFCVSGQAWAGVVSALLLWLVADRLLGRYALNYLSKFAPRRTTAVPFAPALPVESVLHCRRSPAGTSREELAQSSLADATESRLFPPAEVPATEPITGRRRSRGKS